MDGLTEDGSSIPPDTLKAKILDLLESDDSCLEGLGKVLRIDTTRYATVDELVRNYEERFGQLSLKKWRYILRRLGYLEYFQQHVAADQMMADATDILDDLDDLNDEPSQAATKQWSRNEFSGSYRRISSNSQTMRRSLPVHNQLQGNRKSLKHRSREFGHEDDKEFNMDPMTKGAVEMMSDKTNPKATMEWPAWSLPPPENTNKENAVDCSIKDDNHESTYTVDLSTESGFFSENSSLHSLVPETENEASRCETAAKTEEGEETFLATAPHADSSQQSEEITTPARPSTPEAPRSPRNPLVTGHRSCQNINPGAGPVLHPLPSSDGQHVNNSGEESGHPAEHYDYTENNGLLTELQKENEKLRLNILFLVEELRKKNSLCANVLTQGCHVQRQLEESRGQCAQLQRMVEELERRLEESTVLEAESQRLIRMSHELCLLKQHECDRLEEHIRQMDQRYDSANCRMENLTRENQEMSEELRQAIGEVHGLLQERDRNLEAECERLRLDNESRLEESMAAFNNAETDDVKRLKQELEREKNKGKTLEERNEALLEENRQLLELVTQLRSPSSGLCEDCEDDVQESHVSSSTAPSEAEANEQPGSSRQESDSDSDSSEDELFEDARDEFDFS